MNVSSVTKSCIGQRSIKNTNLVTRQSARHVFPQLVQYHCDITRLIHSRDIVSNTSTTKTTTTKSDDQHHQTIGKLTSVNTLKKHRKKTVIFTTSSINAPRFCVNGYPLNENKTKQKDQLSQYESGDRRSGFNHFNKESTPKLSHKKRKQKHSALLLLCLKTIGGVFFPY